MRIRLGWRTDPGKVRARNEDRACAHLLSQLPFAVIAVADGMGGHEAGDVASTVAIEFLERRIGELDGPPANPRAFLKTTFRQVNDLLWTIAQQDQIDMGTTLSVVLLIRRMLFFGHVGDSRIYCISKHESECLTQDHSWIAEQVRAGRMTEKQALDSPYKGLLTRHLGAQPPSEIMLGTRLTRRGETYLCCSDGLHGYVSDNAIISRTRRTRSLNRLARRLIRLANREGGEDNITVALLRMQ